MLSFYLLMIDTDKDKIKFEKLYIQYSRLMQYIADNILHDDCLAEDAVHTAFIKIIANLDKIEDIDCHKTKAFMVIVVENVSKNIYVSRNKHNTISFEDIPFEIADGVDELESLMSDLSIAEIAAKIETLSELDSEILMMRYIHELTNKEISRLLDVKDTVVRKRLERARQRLAALLEKEGGYCGEKSPC